jgi:hypothetical protein
MKPDETSTATNLPQVALSSHLGTPRWGILAVRQEKTMFEIFRGDVEVVAPANTVTLISVKLIFCI